MTREETAWVAGLFEGRGSIALRHGKLHLQVKTTHPETVERFAALVGCGSVYGPYANRMGEKDGYPRNDFFVWATKAGQADIVLELFWSWLSTAKQERALTLGFRRERQIT